MEHYAEEEIVCMSLHVNHIADCLHTGRVHEIIQYHLMLVVLYYIL